MAHVMVYEAFAEEEREMRKALPPAIEALFSAQTIQEMGEPSPRCPFISVRTQSLIPISWADSLAGVLTRSQGYDHLAAFQREARKDLPCGYLGNYCARAVAEQAVLMMMALWRKLGRQARQFKTFTRDGLTGKECRGRRALVVGVGNIGSEMVEMLFALGLQVRGVDLVRTRTDMEFVSLDEGVGWADAIFCALPLTDQTRGMFNRDIFKRAQKGFIFINIARGEISPVDDLKELLDEGILGGLGMDVYPEEPRLADSFRSGRPEAFAEGRLIEAMAGDDRVIFTPHNAFNTQEALAQKVSWSVFSMEEFLKKGAFPWPVPGR